MEILKSYLKGKWQSGKGTPIESYHAIDGSVISLVNTENLDFQGSLAYARDKGKILRKMDFHQRALMVKKLGLTLLENKEQFYKISYQTGATKKDSWIDIEGGINTLFALSSLARKSLPALPFEVEEETSVLSKKGGFVGKHILTPKKGVVLHINSFNFPCWGMLEKIGVNLIAGVPAIIKPATVSAQLTQAMVECIIQAGIMPEGSLQLVSGPIGNMLDYMEYTDTVTFTGSQDTAQKIKSHPNLLKKSVKVNIEADSLNCCILGSDVKVEDEEFHLFIKEIVNEISTKAGQRCTCIRRILVPKHLEQAVSNHLIQALEQKIIGDPAKEGVEIGALISKKQVEDVHTQVELLKTQAEVIFQTKQGFKTDNPEKGAFFPITLLKSQQQNLDALVHQIEAFGPVSSMITYDSIDNAVEMIEAGKGSLVSSIFSNNLDELKNWVSEISSNHGRLMLINRENAKESTGHGTVMPHLVHGGPGRAGGGEELGGVRGIRHYLQRTALQGSSDMLTHITGQWVKGTKTIPSENHPFKKYYEDLQLGDSLITHRRTVTEADIVNFGCLSGDHFYAHFDEIAAKDSLFKARVAHGYFVISMAAGLFVHPSVGPVLANYGLENLRFIQPVYIGDTLQVKLNFMKKNIKTHKQSEQPHGVVYWDVEVINQNNQIVASYEILTLVATKPK